MNISVSPLQNVTGLKKSQYIEDEAVRLFVRNKHKSLCNHNQNKVKKVNVDRVHALEEYLLKDFKERFDRVYKQHSDITVVLCGKFAQNYFKKCYESRLDSIDFREIIHPSYSNWSDNRFITRIKKDSNTILEKELLEEIKAYYHKNP